MGQAKSPKQAVLLIHGIGEQRPMDTLRGFVKTLWNRDQAVKHPFAEAGVYSKPDQLSGNFELRRLTTSKNKQGVRTDFYEFYWAHLMKGTSLTHVFNWLKSLLLRWPWTVPKALRSSWYLLIVFVSLAALCAINALMPAEQKFFSVAPWVSVSLSIALTLLIIPVIKNVIGDAARYLDSSPANVYLRNQIRRQGVEILDQLHSSKDYQRIIVVGHSLGSVIGYDILTHAWPNYQAAIKADSYASQDALEAMATTDEFELEQYQKLQNQLLKDYWVDNDKPWLVSDFITLGSPLAHSAILLGKDFSQLQSKQADRELPTNPPALEKGKISYPQNRSKRIPHHAAMFAVTRWQNLYFPASYVIKGDLIAGPLRPIFGKGIKDVAVNTKQSFGLFSHTHYWSESNRSDSKKPENKKLDTQSHITELRKAVNLLDL